MICITCWAGVDLLSPECSCGWLAGCEVCCGERYPHGSRWSGRGNGGGRKKKDELGLALCDICSVNMILVWACIWLCFNVLFAGKHPALRYTLKSLARVVQASSPRGQPFRRWPLPRGCLGELLRAGIWLQPSFGILHWNNPKPRFHCDATRDDGP